MNVAPRLRKRFTDSCRAGDISYETVIRAVYERTSKLWQSGFAIDGGAHRGFHTLPLAMIESVTRVYAFEPSAEPMKHLAAVVRKRAPKDKVELIAAALQDDPNAVSVDFEVSPTHPGRSGINPILRNRDDTQFDAPISVPATTIDKTCVGAPGVCHFIKLDLEGGEFNALKGAETILLRDAPLIVFENGIHAPKIGGYTREAFLGYLHDVGMVMVTAFGDIGTPENMRDFWYGWACGAQDAERIQRFVSDEAKRVYWAAEAERSATGPDS